MRPLASLRTVLEMIKFEHTLFALPFAFMGMMLAADGLPDWSTVGWMVMSPRSDAGFSISPTTSPAIRHCRRCSATGPPGA